MPSAPVPNTDFIPTDLHGSDFALHHKEIGSHFTFWFQKSGCLYFHKCYRLPGYEGHTVYTILKLDHCLGDVLHHIKCYTKHQILFDTDEFDFFGASSSQFWDDSSVVKEDRTYTLEGFHIGFIHIAPQGDIPVVLDE